MKTFIETSVVVRIFAFAAAFILIAGNASAQTVTGSGTAGRIPVWTGTTTQSNSVITQSAGNIGIGTAAPAGVLGVISTTATPAIYGRDTINGVGVYGVSNTSIGILGTSSTNVGVAGYSPNSFGVWGLSGEGTGVYGSASSAGGYGGYFYSSAYRAGYFKAGNTSFFSLFVDNQGSVNDIVFVDAGSMEVYGNLTVDGSKAGYVVDEMQNADSVNLEAGDVVVIAEDSSAPVLGKIPVPRVKLASSPNDTAVVGVVDQVMYVPDQATRDAYKAQQKADRDAASRAGGDSWTKDSPMADIKNRISDEAGTLHADNNAFSARPGRYCSVVTLGAYKAVKVDASFGAIRAGDLLTTSSHLGYAMRVNDKTAASGAIIGKALSSLAGGTGTVTVMVTLK